MWKQLQENLDSRGKCEAKLARFDGTNEDEFNVWCLRVRAALGSGEPATSLIDEEVDDSVNEKTLAIIMLTLGNNFLRAIQECTTAKSEWSKLHDKYACRTMINELGVLNTLINMSHKVNENMRDQAASPECQLTKFAIIQVIIEMSMRVGNILSFFANLQAYTLIIISINTMSENMTIWNYITMVLIEERESSLQRA